MSTYHLNISNLALTNSDGVLFSRIFNIRGNYYGINASGIFAINVPDPDCDIQEVCEVQTCHNNLQIDSSKRLPEIRANKTGEIAASIYYDGQLAGDGIEAQQTGFIRFGKGGGGRFVAMNFKSKSPQFSIRNIELLPQQIGVGNF